MASKITFAIALLLNNTSAKYYNHQAMAPLSSSELTALSQPLEDDSYPMVHHHTHHRDNNMMQTEVETETEVNAIAESAVTN